MFKRSCPIIKNKVKKIMGKNKKNKFEKLQGRGLLSMRERLLEKVEGCFGEIWKLQFHWRIKSATNYMQIKPFKGEEFRSSFTSYSCSLLFHVFFGKKIGRFFSEKISQYLCISIAEHWKKMTRKNNTEG